MARFNKESILINKYGLSRSDFYEINKENELITILKRTGIDKICKMESIVIEDIQVNATSGAIPAITGDAQVLVFYAKVVGVVNNDRHVSIASASPLDCAHARFAEIAVKRAKHRLILEALDLYELNIYSEIESNEFRERKEKPQAKVNKTPEQELDETFGTLPRGSTESMKRTRIRKKA